MGEELWAELAKRVTMARKKAGLTQEELAERASISPTYIGFIEQGRRKPNPRTLQKICEGLGVRLEDLFRGL